MSLPKILAPLLPHSQRQQKHKDSPAINEFVLSPTLLLSPRRNNSVNENGDPIIGLSTVEENASAESDELIMDESDESTEISPRSTEHTVILHENPTAFELCDNDLIIESVEENEAFDKDMMRDSNLTTMYHSSTTTTSATTINFTPPADYFDQQHEEIQPAMVPLPPSPPIPGSPEKQHQQHEQFDFSKPIQADQVHQSVFESPKFSLKKEEKQSHFVMETTFKIFDNVFKSKYKKMTLGAKNLVCKPEVPKHSTFSSKFEKEPISAGRGGYGGTDTKFVSAFDRKSEEEEQGDTSTPIYHRCNTSEISLIATAKPTEPYESPIVGSNAYDLKLLCDQSFFGRW